MHVGAWRALLLACAVRCVLCGMQAVQNKVVEPVGDAVRVLEVVWRNAAMRTPGMAMLSRSIFNCLSQDRDLSRALQAVRPHPLPCSPSCSQP